MTKNPYNPLNKEEVEEFGLVKVMIKNPYNPLNKEEVEEFGLVKVRCINYKPNKNRICTTGRCKCIPFGCKYPFWIDWIQYIKYRCYYKIVEEGDE